MIAGSTYIGNGTTQGFRVVRTSEPEPVVFRVWRKGGGVLALFPAWPTDMYGRYCGSYEHVGQHGSADYAHCVRQSRPARPAEYRELARELRGLGHRLIIRRRATPPMRRIFRAIMDGWYLADYHDTVRHTRTG